MTFDRMNYESVELSKEEKSTISNTIKIVESLQEEMRKCEYDEVIDDIGRTVYHYDIPELLQVLNIIMNVNKIC